MNETEAKWLEYACGIATCPDSHRAKCIALGAATSQPGCCVGNDLRWPGYLGANYRPGVGVLFVGAVHGAESPDASDDLKRTSDALTNLLKGWTAQPRSRSRDEQFLRDFQRAFVKAAVLWKRWKVFAKILEALKLSIEQVAYTNLAKCKAYDAGYKHIKLCQSEFAPISSLVQTLNPRAIFTCVLPAALGGRLGVQWCDSRRECPPVYPFDGRTQMDGYGRKFEIWMKDVAGKLLAT